MSHLDSSPNADPTLREDASDNTETGDLDYTEAGVLPDEGDNSKKVLWGGLGITILFLVALLGYKLVPKPDTKPILLSVQPSPGFSKDDEKLVTQAEAAEQKRDYKAAKENYEVILKLPGKSDSTPILASIARCDAEMGDWAASAKVLESVIQIKKEDRFARTELAAALMKLNRIPEGEAQLQRAASIAVASYAQYKAAPNVGNEPVTKKDVAEAYDRLLTAASIHRDVSLTEFCLNELVPKWRSPKPDDGNSWAMIADTDAKDHKLERAADEFLKASILQPSHAELLFKYASQLYAMKKYDQAQEPFRRAIEIQQRDVPSEWYGALGLSCLEGKALHLLPAISNLEKATRNGKSNNGEWYAGLARAYYLSRNSDEGWADKARLAIKNARANNVEKPFFKEIGL